MKTTVKVSEYYGVATYYSVMPRIIFDALETAALNGNEFAELDKDLVDAMHKAYEAKEKL